METIRRINPVTVSVETAGSKEKSVSNFWEQAEFNRLGIVALLLTFTACLGGITAGFGVDGSPLQLLLAIFPTGFVLISILALLPMRVIFAIASLSVIINILILIF